MYGPKVPDLYGDQKIGPLSLGHKVLFCRFTEAGN